MYAWNAQDNTFTYRKTPLPLFWAMPRLVGDKMMRGLYIPNAKSTELNVFSQLKKQTLFASGSKESCDLNI